MQGRLRMSALAGAFAALAGLLALCAAAQAVMPQQTPGAAVPLSAANAQISGPSAGAHGGYSIASVGDVNGDGFNDLVIGAPGAGNNGRAGSGSAYVVFGKPSFGSIDLGSLGSNGFRIDGAAAGDALGTSVAAAGDVNGDGLMDVLVGAPGADPSARLGAGAAYVVYGRPQGTPIDLTALGGRGYRIDGAYAGAEAGTSVANAGDVNGDGRLDQAIGMPATSSLAPVQGAAAVSYGIATDPTQLAGAHVDLADPLAVAYTVQGQIAGDLLGASVAGIGDLTGDGVPDLLVGAPQDGAPDRPGAGAAYVVAGRNDGSAVPATSAATLELLGPAAGAHTGAVVTGIGDIDADGRPDLAVGSWGATAGGRAGNGVVDVVTSLPSAPGPIDLAHGIGNLGFRIVGALPSDLTGWSVAGGGDVDGDGLPDLLVGAFGASPAGAASGGTATLIPGHPGLAGSTIDLGLHASGFEADGTAQMGAGSAVAVADVNGDGHADVIVGAADASPSGRAGAGQVFVQFGYGAPAFSYASSVAGRSLTPVTPVGPVIGARTGAALKFSIAPALPQGLLLDPARGVISGTALAPLPPTTYTVTMTDLAGSTTAPLTVQMADGTPPVLGLAFLDSRLSKVVASGKLRLSLGLDEAATIVVTIIAPKAPARGKHTGDPIVLATLHRTIPAGGKTITVVLSRTMRALMRARLAVRKIKTTDMTAVVQATDGSGNVKTGGFDGSLAR
jgi:hypothetical protein